MMCCVNLKHIPSIFPWTSLSFLWPPSFLPQPGRGFWLNLSWGIISSFFTNTCLCIPLFPPILFSRGSSFGTVKGLALFHRKLGKWGAGMRSGCYLTSHGALHGMLTLCEWRRQWHTALRFPILQGQLSFESSDACVGSCIVSPEPFDPHWLVGIPPPKDIPHELIGAKQCLRPSLKDYLKHPLKLPPHTPPV